MVRVKVCGVTSVADAVMSADAGADAIGLNFWPGSPRYCDPSVARDVTEAVGSRVLVVGVFVDASLDEIERMRERVGFGCVQLHGAEPPEMLQALLPHAYKALRVRGPSVVSEAARYAGEHILLDAFVPGMAGGTGATFDWDLAREVARVRQVTLAGGLTPENVAEAVERVRPYCVDVASGVESEPGRKDAGRVMAFVRAAKGE